MDLLNFSGHCKIYNGQYSVEYHCNTALSQMFFLKVQIAGAQDKTAFVLFLQFRFYHSRLYLDRIKEPFYFLFEVLCS